MNNKKIPLTMNVLFSGIGAQEKGFINSGLYDVKVLTTSEINKEAVLSYAAIHCGLTKEMIDTYTGYPSREEMAKYLTNINLGYDPDKNKSYDWNKLARRKDRSIEKYWLACKLTNNLGDIKSVNELPYADLWTCSFPCTDISVSGKMKGFAPDSDTRSSLLWENIRLLKKAVEHNNVPKYILFENVKNLVSKRFIEDFNILISILNDLGFNVYWKVLNGKFCGIPQSRERVFVVAVNKNIDTGKMKFPVPFDNGLRLKDMIEENVDEKHYLSEDIQRRFKITDISGIKNILGTVKPITRKIGQRDIVYNRKGIIGSLLSTDYKQPKQIYIDKSINNTKVIEYANCLTSRENRGISNRQCEGTAVLEQIGQIYGTKKEPNPQAGRIYSENGLSPTITCFQGGNTEPKILQRPRGFNKGGEYETCPSLTKSSWETNNLLKENSFRIRKLTPKEYWRLMGFEDIDCDRAIDIGVSDSQLYKQAGNSIIVNCVELIAEHLYKAQYDNTYICYDEKFLSTNKREKENIK